MAKRLSENEKEEIARSFSKGKTIQELSEEFKCTKLTILRNLKINLGEKRYKELSEKSKLSSKKSFENKKSNSFNEKKISNLNKENAKFESEPFPVSPFIEITPLSFEIDNSPQKDLSSVPISEVDFPKTLYMVVDKKIELKIKYLKDYPDWQFLSQDELNRKTIEIYQDLKKAKRFCNKEEKVIKVPNTDVFKIVAPLLLSKGISRIVSSDKLIAL